MSGRDVPDRKRSRLEKIPRKSNSSNKQKKQGRGGCPAVHRKNRGEKSPQRKSRSKANSRSPKKHEHEHAHLTRRMAIGKVDPSNLKILPNPTDAARRFPSRGRSAGGKARKSGRWQGRIIRQAAVTGKGGWVSMSYARKNLSDAVSLFERW